MQTVKVESAALVQIGYDAATQQLIVEFRDGAIYHYLGIPAAVHASLVSASSKGQHFNQAIRGNYPFTRFRREQLHA